MPQVELLAITWVSVLNDPDLGLRLPPDQTGRLRDGEGRDHESEHNTRGNPQLDVSCLPVPKAVQPTQHRDRTPSVVVDVSVTSSFGPPWPRMR
jgi:hypothetical protein